MEVLAKNKNPKPRMWGIKVEGRNNELVCFSDNNVILNRTGLTNLLLSASILESIRFSPNLMLL